ncbi:MAG: ribonuclease P protein component [Hyphomicrobium sp.]
MEDTSIPAIATLKTRPEFLAVRGGSRASCSACLIEGRPRLGLTASETAPPPRFGFTVTKKLGNAVFRNRIRRRLKAAIGTVAPDRAEPGFDYVIVARTAALDRPFSALVSDLEKALDALHRRRPTSSSQLDGPPDRSQSKKTAP